MKWTKGRKKAWELIQWEYQPFPALKQNLDYYGLNNIKEDPSGTSTDKAYFDFSERGKLPESVTSLSEFLSIIVAHRRLALEVTTWKEDFRDGILFKDDFNEEPPSVQDLAKDACESVGRKWL